MGSLDFITSLLGAIGGLFLLLAALPLAERTRVQCVAALACAGLGVTTTLQSLDAGRADAPLVAAIMTLLCASLLYRSIRPRSRSAALLVLLSGLVAFTWMSSQDGLAALILEDNSRQAWIHTIERWFLFVTLVLSLSIFADPVGDGGAWLWAVFILLWTGIHQGAGLLQSELFLQSNDPWTLLGDPLTIATIQTPWMIALAAIALSQSVALHPRLQRPQNKPSG